MMKWLLCIAFLVPSVCFSFSFSIPIQNQSFNVSSGHCSVELVEPTLNGTSKSSGIAAHLNKLNIEPKEQGKLDITLTGKPKGTLYFSYNVKSLVTNEIIGKFYAAYLVSSGRMTITGKAKDVEFSAIQDTTEGYIISCKDDSAIPADIK